MLRRTAGFGIILKTLPARRAYPAHAGQPMAAALRGFSPIAVPLLKRGCNYANVLRGADRIHSRRRRFLVRQPASPRSTAAPQPSGSGRGKIADCA